MRRLLPLLLVGLFLLPAAGAAAASPVGGPVRFEPAPGTMLRLEGHGPYRGNLEVRRDGAELMVVNELDIESYVMGLKEVPGHWPMEALKAQAVAARTYVLWEAQRGYWQRFGFDVCATTSCQVYGGALAERGEDGRRWVAAVRATQGEVLLHDGEPILARYHASSGGRTLPNEAVYPSSGPRPYLRAVDDPADEVSPLHRWAVTFRREELQEILRVAIELAGELTEVEADPDARRVVLRTKGGELELSTVRMRREISEHAPKAYPDRFPAPRADGKLMPETLPSSRFRVVRTEDGFRFEGRGYGHGVGMSQWGAKGRAERGDDYRAILSAYYGGLEPQVYGAPALLRVGIVRDASEAVVFGDGPFSVSAAGDGLARSTLGSWTVHRVGGSRALDVTPPEGASLPLVLSGLEVPDELVHDPPRGSSLEVGFVLPKPAEVEAVLLHGDERVGRASGIFEAGAATLPIPLDAERLEEGDHRVVLTAFDGTDRIQKSAGVRITIPGGRGWVLGVLAALTAGAAAALATRRAAPPTPPAASTGPGPGSRVRAPGDLAGPRRL